MILYIINLIISLACALRQAYYQDIPAAAGWVCAALWLILLIVKESRKE